MQNSIIRSLSQMVNLSQMVDLPAEWPIRHPLMVFETHLEQKSSPDLPESIEEPEVENCTQS